MNGASTPLIPANGRQFRFLRHMIFRRFFEFGLYDGLRWRLDCRSEEEREQDGCRAEGDGDEADHPVAGEWAVFVFFAHEGAADGGGDAGGQVRDGRVEAREGAAGRGVGGAEHHRLRGDDAAGRATHERGGYQDRGSQAHGREVGDDQG